MRKHLTPSLVISILALVVASTRLAEAARHAIARALSGTIDGHRLSARPYPGGVLLLGRNRRFPAAAITTVRDAERLDGMSVDVLFSLSSRHG